MKLIGEIEFSNICTMIYNNGNLLRAIVLMLMANEYEIFSSGAVYSVVIETITKIFKEENPGKLNPIKDRKLWKQFKEKIDEIYSKDIEPNLDEYGKDILPSRINDLNQPTNKAKLEKPFDLIGIELTPIDKDAINKRNDFLHGRHPVNDDPLATDNKSKFGELYYVNLRLHQLINKFILKYLGYNGKIINYVKIFEKITGKTIDEDYYIDV